MYIAQLALPELFDVCVEAVMRASVEGDYCLFTHFIAAQNDVGHVDIFTYGELIFFMEEAAKISRSTISVVRELAMTNFAAAEDRANAIADQWLQACMCEEELPELEVSGDLFA